MRLMKTFNMCDYDSSWNVLITACELFEEIASEVGEIFEYEYNYDEAKRSFVFIFPHHVTINSFSSKTIFFFSLNLDNQIYPF